jgi:excisionase family DNA binding protein
MRIEASGNNDEWLTVRESARLTGYHEEYVRLLIREGKVVARKFGSVWAVNKPSILKYLKSAENSLDRRNGPK